MKRVKMKLLKVEEAVYQSSRVQSCNQACRGPDKSQGCTMPISHPLDYDKAIKAIVKKKFKSQRESNRFFILTEYVRLLVVVTCENHNLAFSLSTNLLTR